MIKNKIFALALIFSLTSIPAIAYDQPHLVLGLEYFDWNDDDMSNDDSLGVNIEYRSKNLGEYCNDYLNNVSWLVGADLTGKKDFFGYVGLLYDWNFYDNFSLVPNIAAGLYNHGDGQDLGGAFNFRSAIELNYAISEESRMGIAVNHHSNAGLHDSNPGMESVVLSYSFSF